MGASGCDTIWDFPWDAPDRPQDVVWERPRRAPKIWNVRWDASASPQDVAWDGPGDLYVTRVCSNTNGYMPEVTQDITSAKGDIIPRYCSSAKNRVPISSDAFSGRSRQDGMHIRQKPPRPCASMDRDGFIVIY